jgi:hypothetical protein
MMTALFTSLRFGPANNLGFRFFDEPGRHP